MSGFFARSLAFAVLLAVALGRDARADAIDEIARPAIRVFRDRDGLPQNCGEEAVAGRRLFRPHIVFMENGGDGRRRGDASHPRGGA